MQLVSKPQQFDVMVMGNLYGDLVSDLGAGLVGGISATAGINVGEGVRVYETFAMAATATSSGRIGPIPLPLLLPAIDLLKGIEQRRPPVPHLERGGNRAHRRRGAAV